MGLVPDARIDELVYGQLLTREAGVVPGSEEIAALVRGVDPLMSAAEVAVKHISLELGALIHEKHSIVRQADLARLWYLASAHNRGIRTRVMGRSEQTLPQ